jgi:hypothetical protein
MPRRKRAQLAVMISTGRRLLSTGMEVRAVVTICGVIKARATVKVLVFVTVYGLAMVALLLRRIAIP